QDGVGGQADTTQPAGLDLGRSSRSEGRTRLISHVQLTSDQSATIPAGPEPARASPGVAAGSTTGPRQSGTAADPQSTPGDQPIPCPQFGLILARDSR